MYIWYILFGYNVWPTNMQRYDSIQNITIGINHFSQIFLWLGCNCNNQGSTKTDGSNCTSKCCDDDGSCQCKSGYAGESCNKCLPGYHVSAIINSEVTCDGLYTLSISQ